MQLNPGVYEAIVPDERFVLGKHRIEVTCGNVAA
jgi:hypothetical protein